MKAFPRRAGPPMAEPLLLADVLVHLKESPGVADAYIEALITVARTACEERTERTLVSTPWVLTLDAFPDAIELLHPPTLAVTSVSYMDADNVAQTLDPSDYLVDTASEPGYLVPAPGKAWPQTFDRINVVMISYRAGYGEDGTKVPAPLKHWMLLAIGEMYANRNAASDKPRVRNEFADVFLDAYRVMGV